MEKPRYTPPQLKEHGVLTSTQFSLNFSARVEASVSDEGVTAEWDVEHTDGTRSKGALNPPPGHELAE